MVQNVLDFLPDIKNQVELEKQKSFSRVRHSLAPKQVSEVEVSANKYNAVSATIDILKFANRPLSNSEIVTLARAKLSHPISPTRFGKFRSDGRKKIHKVGGVISSDFIVPALSTESLMERDGFLALSTWSIENRLVAPQTVGLQTARLSIDLLRLKSNKTSNQAEINSELAKLMRLMLSIETWQSELEPHFISLESKCTSEIETHSKVEKNKILTATKQLTTKALEDENSEIIKMLGLSN